MELILGVVPAGLDTVDHIFVEGHFVNYIWKYFAGTDLPIIFLNLTLMEVH